MTQDKKGNGAQPTTRNESNLHESGSQKRERERGLNTCYTLANESSEFFVPTKIL